MSVRKISARRLSNFSGPRRAKPKVNLQKRKLHANLEAEKELVKALMSDAQIVRAFERGMGLPSGPMTVWWDNDHSWGLTQVNPRELPEWENLTEKFKIFIGFDVAMEFEMAWAFSVNLEVGMVRQWESGTRGILYNVCQRLRRALATAGFDDLAYCFILETRTRTGRSKTKPHLHGLALLPDPISATRFKVALERAFNPALGRPGRSRSIKVERAYDYEHNFAGRSRWVDYMTKNVQRWDVALGKRRVFLSHEFTSTARMAWEVRRSGE